MQPTPELERFLRKVPLFAQVQPGAPQAALARLLEPEMLKAGQTLFREGEPGTSMWLLGEGVEVAVAAVNVPTGRPQALAYARDGDTLGELSLVDGGPRSGTARVIHGGPALRLETQGFQELRRAWSSAAYDVLRVLAQQLCAKLRSTSDRIVPHSEEPPPPTPSVPGRRPEPSELSALPALSRVPEVVKLALSQKMELLEYPGIQPIFAEGEEADAAYFVLDGEVTVGRNGRTLATLGPGKMFGMVAALDGGRRSASCLTAGPSRLLRLKDRDFDSLFSAGHRFAYLLVDLVCRQLAEHIREANRLLPAAGDTGEIRLPALGQGALPVLEEEDFLPEAEVLPLELEVALMPGGDEPLAGAR